MRKQDIVSYRAGTDSDRAMIFATWLKGLRHGNRWFSLIPEQIYFTQYHRMIELILGRAEVKVQIACLKEDEDVILGYSVTQPETLHWVYVKPAWRGIGIARDLIPKDTKVMTHYTSVGLSLKPKEVMIEPIL